MLPECLAAAQIMLVILLLAICAAVLGGLVGWFSRGKICATVGVCFFLSDLILATLMITFSSAKWPDVPSFLVDLTLDEFLPFIFLFGPCVAAGLLTSALAQSAKPRE